MTFAEELFDRLAASRKPGEQLPKVRWLEIVQSSFEKAKPAKTTKKKAVSKMTDEEWLKHLEAEPSLVGVDIRRELGKAQFWCNENSRQCTRKFFTNWLNKAPRTITVSGAGQTSRRQVSADINVEPAGWFAVAVRLFGQYAADQFKESGWRGIDPHYRKQIVKELL